MLGAIAAYLMAGMSSRSSTRHRARCRPASSSSPWEKAAFPQYLFFSFTTLTTTGYGNLVPDANPGQTFAVLEMLIGQLFLVTAVARVVSAWQTAQDCAPSPDDLS